MAIRQPRRHEALTRQELLNVAFAGSGPWWLLCPYDVESLDPAVIEEAQRTHPFLSRRGEHAASATFRNVDEISLPFAAPLPAPPADAPRIDFTEADIPAVRHFVADEAARAGMEPVHRDEIALAVHEAAANSICHGGGFGTLRVWTEPDALVCEISDAGQIYEPLIGREQPTTDQLRGRGLWLVNQLCDLVQLRSFPTGTVVRMHIRRS